MIIVVTGWRRHPHPHAVYDVLDQLRASLADGEGLLVIHGDYFTGADRYTRLWCWRRGVPQIPFPAADYGRWPWAGPRRNKAMLTRLVADDDPDKRVIAFPQPDWKTARVCGTRGAIGEARKAGIEPDIHVVQVAVTDQKGSQL